MQEKIANKVQGTFREKLMVELACPFCKGDLKYQGGILECVTCETRFPVNDGIPNFLPKELNDKYNAGLKEQDLIEEQNFYQKLYSDLDGADDGHCVVYGYDELYKFMEDIPKGRLLDLGCGAGQHSKDLAQMGYAVIGIDISSNGLAQAKIVNREFSENTDFILGDIENLPFKDQSFDVVFCGLILHHFPKLDKLLSELARVSKKYVVAFEVNADEPITALRFNVLNKLGFGKITRNQRAIYAKRLERDLQHYGFREFVTKHINVHHYTGRHSTSLQARILVLYRSIMRLFPDKFSCNKFLFKCHK